MFSLWYQFLTRYATYLENSVQSNTRRLDCNNGRHRLMLLYLRRSWHTIRRWSRPVGLDCYLGRQHDDAQCDRYWRLCHLKNGVYSSDYLTFHVFRAWPGPWVSDMRGSTVGRYFVEWSSGMKLATPPDHQRVYFVCQLACCSLLKHLVLTTWSFSTLSQSFYSPHPVDLGCIVVCS